MNFLCSFRIKPTKLRVFIVKSSTTNASFVIDLPVSFLTVFRQTGLKRFTALTCHIEYISKMTVKGQEE